jgi:hypothetical protein
MRVVACLLFLVAPVAVAATSLPAPRGTRRPAASPVPWGLDAPKFQHLSSASCSAAACHGNGKIGAAGGEHSTWAPDLTAGGPHDPHSKAYRVLFNDDSVRISKLLGLAPAHKEPLCLKCHTVPGVRPALAVSEGVGCGACHGPAEKWATVHYLPAWKALSEKEKWERYGFLPARNTTARVHNCVGCHVGDATREVNHEMLAAGHPRLTFEAARFHFHPAYRKHWVEATPQPDFEVRAWVIGQAAAARAAAALLQARAARAAADEPRASWPELAGLSCYACHQAIRPSPRGLAGRDRRPALPRWEPWSTGAVEVAAAFTPEVFPGCPAPSLTAVRELQKAMEEQVPGPKMVREKAAAAVKQLGAWLANLQAAEERPRRLAPGLPRKMAGALADSALAPGRGALRTHDWDDLATHALGCGAMLHAAGGAEAVPRLARPTRGLFEALRFPAPVRGKRPRSPAGVDGEKLRRAYQQFLEFSRATRSGGKE